MTDQTNNFNDSPRECLEHYATKRPDSIMGYRPYVDNELTRHFVALGALEWRALDGVKYCKTTSDGQRMLEEYRHGETKYLLDAANARIAELEAVCREVVGVFEIQPDSNLIRLGFGVDNFARVAIFDDATLTALRHLLDSLPPSDVS